jgi:gamma-carbonic anhydrase
VHVKTRLKPGACVPIGWIACGDPAQLFSPDRHEALWEFREKFSAYGLWHRPADARPYEAIAERHSSRHGGHLGDKVIG